MSKLIITISLLTTLGSAYALGLKPDARGQTGITPGARGETGLVIMLPKDNNLTLAPCR
jgi:hypothetical protein